MNTNWIEFLQAAGARHDGSAVTGFGHPAEELQAAATGSIVADLSHLGVLTFSGEDAASFLQAQLTNDLRPITQAQNQYSGYCSAKGRLLASFLVWRSEAGYHLQLPLALTPAMAKRLRMFVLRAKVEVTDSSDQYVRLGIAGANAAEALKAWWPELPAPHGTAHCAAGVLLGLPGPRYEAVVSEATARPLFDALKTVAQPAGADAWCWLDIREGIPTVLPATQEAFVPQMVNFDAIGAVSFKKGCYPGQEIVARTQYLGALKRRMVQVHGAGPAPAAGEAIYAPEDQVVGQVVNAAPAPNGGFDALAVVLIEARQQPLRTAGGALRPGTLPYPVSEGG